MSQIFHRYTNIYSRLSILAAVGFAAVLGGTVGLLHLSGYNTGQDQYVDQPIQFSHAHHVGGMGIDCRYCHTSVEESAFANIPPTKTCMNCHSQIWANAPILEPVRASFRDNTPPSLDARPRSAGFRVFQPQHPRAAGGRLRDVPRAGRSDAPDVPGEDAARCPGAWTATGIPRSTSGRAIRCSTWPGSARRTTRTSAAPGRRSTRSRASTSSRAARRATGRLLKILTRKYLLRRLTRRSRVRVKAGSSGTGH